MSSDRVYPLARPKGHKPPMERWKLEFDEPGQIHTVYIGVQRHDSTPNTLATFESATKAVESWLEKNEECPQYEKFHFLEGDDLPESITWVAYWPDATTYNGHIALLNLRDIYTSLNKPPTIGLWTEQFSTPTSRLETNYSGLDYLPGIAGLRGTQTVEHALTAYWGAARDRIPDSGHDLFSPQPEHITQPPSTPPAGVGSYLTGLSPYDNLVHIRSGQFWENCAPIEAEAYVTTLQPTLVAGLRYLWTNRSDSGAMGLRFLRNARDTHINPSLSTSLSSAKGAAKHDPDPHPDPEAVAEGGDEAIAVAVTEAKETCAAGFFRNLSDLEQWAKRHKSHLAIFNGAIRHAKEFGEERKFRTWHEVSILKKGEARFEYLNCRPGTGVMGYLPLEDEGI
ncbi:hem-containing dehydratase protein [Aspergillus karnatakaensis]|uniref:phenylacetaldoxime dehydratase family protein n=1 Tax=Aspergillus karnatakaensis TaxID=1810916 RepID=UPI003CCD32B0